MLNAESNGYQLLQELISLREQVRRTIHDEVIPAESRLVDCAVQIHRGYGVSKSFRWNDGIGRCASAESAKVLTGPSHGNRPQLAALSWRSYGVTA